MAGCRPRSRQYLSNKLGIRKRCVHVCNLRQGFFGQAFCQINVLAIREGQASGHANPRVLAFDTAITLIDSQLAVLGSIYGCKRGRVEAAFGHIAYTMSGAIYAADRYATVIA